jgi:hypothetical protein
VAEVAAAIRDALAADEDVSANYDVTGADADIILTAKVKANNDDTLAITLQSAGDTGVTVGASTNTTPGTAGTAQAETVAVAQVASVNKSVITITGAGTYKYLIDGEAAAPLYLDDVNHWTVIATGDEIAGSYAGQIITIARVDTTGHVLAIGSAEILVA